MRKGFTLIELLIVVAIIGVLSVTLIPTITNGPARARDAVRKANVKKIVESFEKFNIDKGYYPNNSNGVDLDGEGGVWFCLGPVDDANIAPSQDETDLINDYFGGVAPSHPSTVDSPEILFCDDGINGYYGVMRPVDPTDNEYIVATMVETKGLDQIEAYESAGGSGTLYDVFYIKR